MQAATAELQAKIRALLLDYCIVYAVSTVGGLLSMWLYGLDAISICLMAFSLSGKHGMRVLVDDNGATTSVYAIALRVYVAVVVFLVPVVHTGPYDGPTANNLSWHIFVGVLFVSSGLVCWSTRNACDLRAIRNLTAFCSICMSAISVVFEPAWHYNATAFIVLCVETVAAKLCEPGRRSAFEALNDALLSTFAPLHSMFREYVF